MNEIQRVIIRTGWTHTSTQHTGSRHWGEVAMCGAASRHTWYLETFHHQKRYVC